MTLTAILIVVIWLVAIKAIIGLHFPWEVCNCCGKKWRNHKPLKVDVIVKPARYEKPCERPKPTPNPNKTGTG